MNRLLFFRNEIMDELQLICTHQSVPKDILVVVHDQLPLVQSCLISVYVWDNGSLPPTADFLREEAETGRICLARSEENQGFIIPNNRLLKLGSNPYVVLLNSDTEVREGWDRALTGYLEEHPNVAQVGFMGAKLQADGRGGIPGFGTDVHFIPGWCFCSRRNQIESVGLFDEEHLKFAYGEDSDLSLRLQEAGYSIYALHVDLVTHHGNGTIGAVFRELGEYVRGTFQQNHEYIRSRWTKFLSQNSVGLQPEGF